MLLLAFISAASPTTGRAARSRRSKLTAAEELVLAARLLERRRELLAIAILDPASEAELGRITAELDAGTLDVRAVVDEAELSAQEARARFDGFCDQVRAFHAMYGTARGLVPAPDDGGVVGAHPAPAPALQAALRASGEIACSLRLEWTLVDRVLRNSWVQTPRSGRRAAASLPATLAPRVAAAQTEIESIIERFVTDNQGLVHSVAQRYRGLGLSRDDLMQDGNIGLLRAVEKFDARRAKPFAGYAVWWIRHAIRNAVAVQARTIRLPTSALARRFALGKATHRITQQLGRNPSAQELATATGVTAENIADVLEMPKEPLSLDAPTSADGERTLGDCLSDPLASGPIEAASAQERAALLRALFEALTPRERHILGLRFGLDGREEHTLGAIGSSLGLTRERIRQIVGVALAKLGHALEEREPAP